MYRHVIWDLGGTLVDTYPALDRTLAAVVRDAGGQVSEAEVARLTRRSTGEAIAALSSRFGIDEAAFRARLLSHVPAGPAADAFEPDGSAASAKAIANGQTQNHTIHVAGDVDWVKFTVGAAGASKSGALAALSGSQLGELTESLVNAQFSQSQESDADDFSFDLLKKRGIPLQGLASAFDKLAQLGGGDSSMFDSHPGSADRAAHIRQRIAAEQ